MVCLRGATIAGAGLLELGQGATIADAGILELGPGDSTTPTDVSHRDLLTLAYDATGHVVNNEPCPGAGCLNFHFVAIGTMLVFLLAVLGFALHKRLKFRRAVTAGSVPAAMLMSHWNVAAADRGDMEAFAFPVRRPSTREEVNEESCPICLGTTPKAANWVVFGACGHATCLSCFKKLASRYRLHAACPLCRKLLATGEGDRGGQRKPDGQEQGPAGPEGQTPEAAAAAAPDAVAVTPLPGAASLPPQPARDDNV